MQLLYGNLPLFHNDSIRSVLQAGNARRKKTYEFNMHYTESSHTCQEKDKRK